MTFPVHHHCSIRLKNYDYTTPGAYFVTIVTHNRVCLLGNIHDDQVALTRLGEIVAQTWEHLPDHYPNVELDEFVVMPNHLHAVIVLTDRGVWNGSNNDAIGMGPVGAGLKPAPTGVEHDNCRAKPAPLSEIVRALKTFSARQINQVQKTQGTPLWQRNYYEHIIRSESELERIRGYIMNNPLRWDLDEENPKR